MSDLISIIVPIYNAGNTIIPTINSIRNQDYSNLEILLIDDGSTDDSFKICSALEKQDHRIKLFSIKNSGPAAARQYGLDRARGRYVAFCDADDIMEKNMVSTLYHMIERGDCQLSICAFDRESSENCQPREEFHIWDRQEAICKCLTETSVGGYLWNKLFDHQIISQYNIRFDKTVFYCEDLEFVVEYLLHSEKVGYIHKVLYHYIYQDNSLSSGTVSWKKLTNLFAREKVLEKLNKVGMVSAARLAKRELVLQSVYGGRSIEKASPSELQTLTKDQLQKVTCTIQKNCSRYGLDVILHEKCSLKDTVNIIRFGFLKR